MIRDLPYLVGVFWSEVVRTRGLILLNRLYTVAWFLGGIVYILSPIDLVPEAVLGIIGLVDDVIAIILVGLMIGNQVHNALVQRNENEIRRR